MGETNASYGGANNGDGDYPSSTRKSGTAGANADDTYHERTRTFPNTTGPSLAVTLPG